MRCGCGDSRKWYPKQVIAAVPPIYLETVANTQQCRDHRSGIPEPWFWLSSIATHEFVWTRIITYRWHIIGTPTETTGRVGTIKSFLSFLSFPKYKHRRENRAQSPLCADGLEIRSLAPRLSFTDKIPSIQSILGIRLNNTIVLPHTAHTACKKIQHGV